jgi:hypothetical protein
VAGTPPFWSDLIFNLSNCLIRGCYKGIFAFWFSHFFLKYLAIGCWLLVVGYWQEKPGAKAQDPKPKTQGPTINSPVAQLVRALH